MHRRSFPPFGDLGSFLSFLEGKDELATISAPISMHLEITEIHRRVIAAGGPAMRLTRALNGDGTPAALPVVTNLFGTPRRVAWGLGTDMAGLAELGALLAWMRSPQPPQNLKQARLLLPAARGALQARPKIVRAPQQWQETNPDFSQLPVQTCWPGDAGPLITWPVVITRPPGEDDVSTYNLGIYRMQVIGPDRAIIRWLPMRGGASHHRLWQALEQEMPVAVVIGADPATLLAAVMPAPEGISELALAGMINNRRAGLAPCAEIPLHVPASAEIVLEGTVSLTETALEGPFGDHTGYYNAPEYYPVFTLKRMRVRNDAAYLTTFTGRAPDEPAILGTALLEIFKPLLRQQLPEIVDVWLPPEACSYRIAVISIAKKYVGQARRVMMGFWSLLPQFSMTKMLIVVDDDIDISSWADVMWALATRMDPSRDLMLAERTPIDHLDFASPLEGLGGKVGFDATRKVGSETSREWGVKLEMEAAIQHSVNERWPELLSQLGKVMECEGA
ncbi:UbiD family decarboxylase [Falsochrobactrum sp. TDYN1]|uniref:UbiD family decarboxylase n=1 Tax=Falsochrobactrum tianjinense TaxID=2706015 RepID=A0A949PPC6_9HYPH|nr:UbiD family decarboxylase [Falsochrobactrum sp. TDYN1]MBV2143591.1 UbiD family decarboxylase [Falsochrobactrum sp. TDYN1]